MHRQHLSVARHGAAAVPGLAGLYPQVEISSVGTAAVEGSSACGNAGDLVAGVIAKRYPTRPLARFERDRHRSRRMVRQDFEKADLILALDRSHRSAIAQLLPSSRSRTFTLRQAAGASAEVARALRAGRVPDGAPPLPSQRDLQFGWFIEELDAHRAFLHPEAVKGPGSLVIDPLDIPDPHVLGFALHPLSLDLIEQSVATLVGGLAALANLGASRA